MTIPDSLRLSLEAIPTGRGDAPPPVNNACVPDQYNRLDAEAIEKTRVLNALLALKLKVQEKVLLKYRTAAERSYLRERDRVQRDLNNIGRRLPNYADMPHLETEVKRMKRKKKSNSGPLHNCVYTTKPEGIKGISAERDDKPFCDRFFHHHVPTKGKMYKKVLPSVNEGFKMLDFRPRPRALPLLAPHAPREVRDSSDSMTGPGGGRPGGRDTRVPPLHALDDNFMVAKSYRRDEDDDCKTV